MDPRGTNPVLVALIVLGAAGFLMPGDAAIEPQHGWTNNTEIPIEVVTEDWEWQELLPGQTADIDGYLNPSGAPFQGTDSRDAFRKVNDWTHGTFEDDSMTSGGTPLLRDHARYGRFWDAIDYRTGWQDGRWAREKSVPRSAWSTAYGICSE